MSQFIRSLHPTNTMMRAAILDLYNGTPNLGLGSIKQILKERFPEVQYDLFDVRGSNALPGMEYDIYISTGGPGNPLEGNGVWELAYAQWLDQIWQHNQSSDRAKFVFFICHSFQIACHHFKVGKVNLRPEESFGIFRMQKTNAGINDPLFKYLPQPFFAADFRKYQVVDIDTARLQDMGAEVLAMEDPKSHTFKQKAMTAIRFTPTMYGVQFHPEAYPDGMEEHFEQPERKAMIHKLFGLHRYEEMMFHLRDPIKIGLTYDKVLPGFLRFAIKALSFHKVT